MPTNDDPGPGVDAQGNQVVDPTKNVLDLVSAAIKRQDDLREVEGRHIREILDIRQELGKQLRDAETARLNAIREVDVAQVQRAAEVQAAQQTAIATTVATTAEAMRVSLAASLEPIQSAIQDLRRVQYESVGQKTQVVETQAKGANAGLWIGLAVAGGGFLVALIVGASTLVVILSR